MRKVEITTTTYEYDSINELNEDEQLLINKSKDAVKNAYAPYSKFNVGAAVLLENGEIVIGTNQENAAYPSGLCAERVAIFYANSKYPNIAIKSIAVTAFTNDKFIENPLPPCGACRQVIVESETRFNKPIKIYLVSSKKITVVEDAKELLPINFDEDFLS